MSDATSDTSKAAPASAAFDPEAAGWRAMPEDGFLGLVGPLWTRADPGGEPLFGFLAESRHANLIGVVQGGMVMTFADRVLGVLAWEAAGDRPVVTVSFDCQFIGAGRIGSFIEMRGEVIRRTSSLVFMRGLVTSATRPVASCQGTWKILSDRGARGGRTGARVSAPGEADA